MNELNRKQDELYNKVLEVLSRDRVVEDEENTSLLEVKNAVKYQIEPYNKLLIDGNKKKIKSINKKSLTNSLPNVSRIVSSITKNNNIYTKILFDRDLYHDGGYILLGCEDDRMNIITTSFDSGETKKFVEKNYGNLGYNFIIMKAFSKDYPNIEYDFDTCDKCKIENKNEQDLTDGFISSRVNLRNPEEMMASFNSIDDIVTSTTHSKKYGEIYDYLAMYNDEVLSKTSIKINSLNPFLRKVYDEYLIKKEQDKEANLTLSK